MSHLRANLLFLMLACVATAGSWGCSMPFAGSLPTAEERTGSAQPPQVSQKPPVSTEPNLADVFDTMLAIRKIDPTAEAKLVAELQHTPAESWPLVAEQFRASLAYREQLKAKSGNQNETLVSSPSDEITRESSDRKLAGETRPSEAFGALLDPRRADKDDIAKLPDAVPNALPTELTDAAMPMESVYAQQIQQATASGNDGAVVQAKLETVTPPAMAQAPPTAATPPPATPPPTTAPTPPPTETPPVVAPDDADWQTHVKRAVDDLHERVPPSPSTTAELHQHVSLRMLRLLSGDTEKALEPIPHIGPVEQDYWSRQLFALATYLDHHSQPDDKRRAAASVVHLDESVSNLRELGTLTLRNLTFCKEVYGYGAFEPLRKEDFSPGERVTLYVEVENYHSQSTAKGFHTLLGSSYELLNEEGARVGGEEFPDVDDYCRSRRRDFHMQLGIALPEKLSPGPHRLRVIVKDRQSEKMATSEAAFEVRGVVGKIGSGVER